MNGRQRHSREWLIDHMEKMLAKHNRACVEFNNVCRDGVEDTLIELRKPALPDDYETRILCVLTKCGVVAKVGADVLLRELCQVLLPKPKTKTKTVWRVNRGEGNVTFDTEAEAFESARRCLERGESVGIDKREVTV